MGADVDLRNVRRRFGTMTVLDDVSFHLEAGGALGVVGPNGAGKTTMLNVITGTIGVSGGDVLLGGEVITTMSAAARCRHGIARTYQVPQPFLDMTVFENTLVGATHGRGSREDHAAQERAVLALDRTGLTDRANNAAGALTLLQRKRLELARALATGPHVLLLDEIAGGLTEHEVGELVATIQDLRAEGVTLVWIEHIVHALMAAVDRIMVLDFGRKLIEGEPREVMSSPEVRRVYMGIEAA